MQGLSACYWQTESSIPGMIRQSAFNHTKPMNKPSVYAFILIIAKIGNAEAIKTGALRKGIRDGKAPAIL